MDGLSFPTTSIPPSSPYLYSYLIKDFPPYGLFVGQVIRHRPSAAEDKVHRVLYEDGDEEDLSSLEIENLLLRYGQVQPDSVSQYHSAINTIREREEEKKKKAEARRAKKAKLALLPKPPPPLSYPYSTSTDSLSSFPPSTSSSPIPRTPSPALSVSSFSSTIRTNNGTGLTNLIQNTPQLVSCSTIAVLYKKEIYKVLSFNSVGTVVSLEPLYSSHILKGVKTRDCRLLKFVSIDEATGRIKEGTGTGGMKRRNSEDEFEDEENFENETAGDILPCPLSLIPSEYRTSLTVSSILYPSWGEGEVIFGEAGYYIVSFKGDKSQKGYAKNFMVTRAKGIEDWLEEERGRREREGYKKETQASGTPTKQAAPFQFYEKNTPPTSNGAQLSPKINLNSFHWSCSKCTLQNSIKRRLCSICMSPRSLSTEMSTDMRKCVEYVNSVVDRCISTERKWDFTKYPFPLLKYVIPCKVCKKENTIDGMWCKNCWEGRTREEREGKVEEVRKAEITELKGGGKSDGNPSNPNKRNIEEFTMGDEMYPLGMKIRKWFFGYGFFDGVINKIHRVMTGKGSEIEYVYRVNYHDGDQEDMSGRGIRSLREFYDVEGVRECEPMERQVKVGARLEVSGMRGKIVKVIEKWGCVIIDWGGMGTEIVDLRDIQSSICRIWKGGEDRRKGKVETNGKAETASSSGTFQDVIMKNIQAFERLIAHMSYTKNPESFTPKELTMVPGVEECVRKIIFDMKAAGKDFVNKQGHALEENRVRMYILSQLIKVIFPDEDERWGSRHKKKPTLEWPRTKMVVGEFVKGCQYDLEIVGESKNGNGEGRYMIGRNVWLMESPTMDDEDWDTESSSDEEDSDGEVIITISAKTTSPKKVEKTREDVSAINGPYGRKRSAKRLSTGGGDADGDVCDHTTASFRKGGKKCGKKSGKKGTTENKENTPVTKKIKRPPNIWDPAEILPFLEHDPFMTVLCEVCKSSGDDSRLLICDKCERGYHMYCCKPIIAKIPVGEWFCKDCKPDVKNEKERFERRLAKMMSGEPMQKKISSFLKLPTKTPSQFFTKNPQLKSWANTTSFSDRKRNFTYKNHVFEVDGFYLPGKPDFSKNLWNLPEPCMSVACYKEVATRLAVACMEQGMTEYNDNLVYCGKASRRMNNAALDNVSKMSVANTDIYKMFKSNLENGFLLPLSVEYDANQGFVVTATQDIQDKTLLIEYTGAVTRIKDSGKSDSDSLMILLQTDSPKTSLIIDPSNIGNIARFLSGVNNYSSLGRKQVNVRTRRFQVDGECRVVLFSDKKILKGERLAYDYNAGVNAEQGLEQIQKHGFYDTSHFS